MLKNAIPRRDFADFLATDKTAVLSQVLLPVVNVIEYEVLLVCLRRAALLDLAARVSESCIRVVRHILAALSRTDSIEFARWRGIPRPG